MRWLTSFSVVKCEYRVLVPDDVQQDAARAKRDLGEVARLFEGWDPLLTNLLSYRDNVDKVAPNAS